jgi:hypothetical protein
MNIDFPFHFDGRGRTAYADTDAHIRDLIERCFSPRPASESIDRPLVVD